MAGNLGFDTWLVGDATAAFDRRGPDGTLYAHATTTCLVFDLKPPG